MENVLPTTDQMLRAFLSGDSRFDGLFITAVKTTGIFCRPSCPARKPKPENVQFYRTPKDALLAGYRPCLRCRPLEQKGDAPEWIRALLKAVEADPTRRWTGQDLRAQGLEPARVRRWFVREHGMTFQAYQRARRVGLALGHMQNGSDLARAAFEHGFESLSGFHDAFSKLIGTTPGKGRTTMIVHAARLLTPLGPMLAAATEDELCLLEFVDRRMLETQLNRLRQRLECTVVPGSNEVLKRTEKQLEEYFAGKRTDFDLPLRLAGTDFQEAVWRELLTIPYGVTRSYGEQARRINQATAVRAVARANGDNRIAIIIPCHRVIGSDGKLTGYGGGLSRKQFLLDLERRGSGGQVIEQGDLLDEVAAR